MEPYPVFRRSHPWVATLIDSNWWRVLTLWILTEAFRIAISLIALAVVFTVQVPAQEEGTRRPFQSGEVLQYKVKWSFIRLGTVVIRQELTNPDDPSTFCVRMTVRSAQGLPFINVHFINQTILWKYQPSVRTEMIVSGDDETVRTSYIYDSTIGQVIMIDSAQGKLVRRESIPSAIPCFDALGLLMMARIFSGSGDTLSLATLNDYKISQTDIMFTDEVEHLDVDASETPIRCRRFEGNAQWEGSSFAGMTGAFRGWISDDEASVPVRAEVGIFLGSVVLELEQYERSPRFSKGELAHDTTSNQ